MRKLDIKAGKDFRNKAYDCELTGKSMEFVEKEFGKPAFSYNSKNNNEHIWVYIPGPRLAIWNSECRVYFTGSIVTNWRVGLD